MTKGEWVKPLKEKAQLECELLEARVEMARLELADRKGQLADRGEMVLEVAAAMRDLRDNLTEVCCAECRSKVAAEFEAGCRRMEEGE